MTPEALKSWREALTTLPRDGVDATACPEPEQVWAAVRGELTPEDFGPLADHAAGCPLCALAWDLAEQGSGAVGRPGVRPAGRPWRPWYTLAAAAVLVAAAATVMQLRDAGVVPAGSPPEYRAPVEEAITTAMDGATLPKKACTLTWSGPEGATFNLVVSTADFDVIHRRQGFTDNSYTLPEEVLQRLERGAILRWQVEAMLPGGGKRRSRTFQVTLQ